MLTTNLAKAILDFMPCGILADLFEDETGLDGSHIRKGQYPSFTRAECEAVLYGEEVNRLLMFSPVNLVKAIKQNQYAQNFVNYLLYFLRNDFIRTRAVRAAYYGDPVFFTGERIKNRMTYNAFLKIMDVLGRNKEKKSLQLRYWCRFSKPAVINLEDH